MTGLTNSSKEIKEAGIGFGIKIKKKVKTVLVHTKTVLDSPTGRRTVRILCSSLLVVSLFH